MGLSWADDRSQLDRWKSYFRPTRSEMWAWVNQGELDELHSRPLQATSAKVDKV